jgi:excinuclease ABC subunit A
VIDVDLDLVLPDRRKSLTDGAIKPWSTPKTEWEREQLAKFCRRRSIPMDVPFQTLTEEQQALILDGDRGDKKYYSIRRWFRWLEGRTYRMHVRVLLSRYRSYRVCATCNGGRLKADALLYRINGKSVVDVNTMSVADAAALFDTVQLAPHEEEIAHLILSEIRSRLRYLLAVGLDYLALDRQSRTLSGGELARVDLTRAVGSSLVNTLYILDEPSIGLHPRDSQRLVRILQELRAKEYSVVVVEHDTEIIAPPTIIDLGPGAGSTDGQRDFQRYLSSCSRHHRLGDSGVPAGRRTIPVPHRRRPRFATAARRPRRAQAQSA